MDLINKTIQLEKFNISLVKIKLINIFNYVLKLKNYIMN